jgi:hypothetical protein
MPKLSNGAGTSAGSPTPIIILRFPAFLLDQGLVRRPDLNPVDLVRSHAFLSQTWQITASVATGHAHHCNRLQDHVFGKSGEAEQAITGSHI